eukprot:g2824.t1
MLKTVHINEITRTKCNEVQRELRALEQSLSDDLFEAQALPWRNDLEKKLKELELVITGILTRSRAMQLACSMDKKDIQKVDRVLEDLTRLRANEKMDVLGKKLDRLENKLDLAVVDPGAVSAEDKILAQEILALLTTSQNSLLLEGQNQIKAANFREAQQCFEGVLRAPGSLSPEELAKTKLLLVYTHCRVAINCLKDQSFGKAAEIFDEALKQRSEKLSDERLHKLRLFHACALYEAGKQEYENGNLGTARKQFEAAKKTGALPHNFQEKAVRYIQECKE